MVNDLQRHECSESKRNITLLKNLGAEYLINECQKRNISAKELHKLTKEDFWALGAVGRNGEHLHEVLYMPTMGTRLQVDNEKLMRKCQKTLAGMLEDGAQQLQLVQSFVQYARCKLSKQEENINVFVDVDTGLRASEVLELAATVTLDEITYLEEALEDIKKQIPKCDESEKKHRWKSWFYNTCAHYFIIIFGIGVATCTLINVGKVYKVSRLF